MDESTIRQYHVALQQAGTKAGAAKLLGVDRAQIDHAIKKHPELTSYLKGAKPPTESEVISRKKLKPFMASPAERGSAQQTSMALQRLGDQFKRSLELAGVIDAGQLDKIMALQALGANHFTQLRQFHGGSCLDLYLSLKREYDSICETLRTASDTDLDPEYERSLREDRGRIVTAIIQIGDRLDKSVMASAMIEAKKREGKQQNRGKPGFAALTAIKTDNVTIVSGGQPSNASFRDAPLDGSGDPTEDGDGFGDSADAKDSADEGP